MANKRDYYEVLGVHKGAGEDEINRSFKRLAKQYHPDRNPGDEEAVVRFKEVAEAYEVLRDPEKRSRYDRYGHAGLDGAGMPQFTDVDTVFDMFGDMLGEMFGRPRRSGGGRAGRHLQTSVEVTLLEAAFGVTKTIEIERAERCGDCAGSGMRKGSNPARCQRCAGRGVILQRAGFFQMQTTCNACGGRGMVITDPCPACAGHGRVMARRKIDVKIPPGVDTDNVIRLAGEGEAGSEGAPRGDLHCVIRVLPHPLFVREGLHLVCEVPISFSQAALGAEIEVPTLEGKEMVTIPAGVPHGRQIHLRGKGMPDVHGRGRGDLVIQVAIETPKKLTPRQEQLYRELAEIENKHVSPQRKGFLDKVKDWFVGDEPSAG